MEKTISEVNTVTEEMKRKQERDEELYQAVRVLKDEIFPILDKSKKSLFDPSRSKR